MFPVVPSQFGSFQFTTGGASFVQPDTTYHHNTETEAVEHSRQLWERESSQKLSWLRGAVDKRLWDAVGHRITVGDIGNLHGHYLLDGQAVDVDILNSLRDRLNSGLDTEEAVRRTLLEAPARLAASNLAAKMKEEKIRKCSHRWTFMSHEEDYCPQCGGYRMPVRERNDY